MISQIGLAVAAFVSTNVDDLFLVSAYFANAKIARTSIVLGQLLGIGTLVAASAIAALAALIVPDGWAALLGAIPLGLGLHQWLAPSRDEEAGPIQAAERSQLLAIAGVTIANGGDNLGVYIPLFARDPRVIPLYAGIFAVMTAIWCVFGYRIVHNRWAGEPIRRQGHRVLPFVLIGIGVYILLGARALF